MNVLFHILNILFLYFVTFVIGEVLAQNATKESAVLNTTTAAPEIVTTYKYPTATWRPNGNTDVKNGTVDSSTQKLYLFKPSPFLKPPFIDGNFGGSITRIEDGVNVTGKRRGKIKYKLTSKKVKPTVDAPVHIEKNELNDVDKFLEQSLKKYLFSSHFKDIIGDITVQEFAEVLRNITMKEQRRQSMPPYEQNKNHYMKFREESLSPKRKSEESTTTTSNYFLMKQLRRRQEKNLELVSTTSPSMVAFSEEPVNITSTDPASQSTINLNENLVDITTHSMDITSLQPTSEATSTHTPTKKKVRGKVRWTTTTQKTLKKDELQLSVAESSYYTIKPYFEQSISNIEEPVSSIPGEPGLDYPMYSSPPYTGFKCPIFKGNIPRMLADRNTRCQVFYVCTGDGPAAPTLCPNGTMFNEQVLVCDWWYNVDC